MCTGLVLLQPSVICQLIGAEQTGMGQGGHDGDKGSGFCSPAVNRKKATGWEFMAELRLCLAVVGGVLPLFRWCASR